MSFVFTPENLKKAEEHIAKYPEGRQASAVLPLLDLAQRQCGGWLPQPALEGVANLLSMPFIRVLEVASFYSMFNLKPVGAHHVQICGTTPCWLKGAEDLKNACTKHLSIEMGETTEDQKFTLSEVECLGACVNAPMVQIGDDYYENLSPEALVKILEEMKKSKVDNEIQGNIDPWVTITMESFGEDGKEGIASSLDSRVKPENDNGERLPENDNGKRLPENDNGKAVGKREVSSKGKPKNASKKLSSSGLTRGSKAKEKADARSQQ